MRFIFICFALLAAGPAMALSCMRPDPVTLYQTAKSDAADFYIVRGRITLLEPANDPEPSGLKSPVAETRARFEGMALNRNGFKIPIDRTITIEAKCLSAWCGSAQGLDEREMFAALRLDGDTLVLARGPCGGDVMPWDQTGEDRLLTCHSEGECRRPEF